MFHRGQYLSRILKKKLRVPLEKRGHSRKGLKREQGMVPLAATWSPRQMEGGKEGEQWMVTRCLSHVDSEELEKVLKHNQFVFWINPSGGMMGHKFKKKTEGRERC